MNTKRPMWKNFYGEKKKVRDLDDQHLSNIYWFSKVFYGDVWSEITKEVIRRFGSTDNVLLWRPLPIPREIKELRKRGYILGNSIIIKVSDTGTTKHMIIGDISHIPPEMKIL